MSLAVMSAGRAKLESQLKTDWPYRSLNRVQVIILDKVTRSQITTVALSIELI